MKTHDNVLNENDESCASKGLLKLLQTKAYIPESSNSSTNVIIKEPAFNKINDIKKSKNHLLLEEKPHNNLEKTSITNKDLPLSGNIDANSAKTTEYDDFLSGIALFLQNLCKKLQLSEEVSLELEKAIKFFVSSLLEHSQKEEVERKKILCFQLKKLLGNDFKNKMFLIKRASNWLNLNNLDNSEGYLNFLYKMIELGNILSEDQGVKHEQSSVLLSKEEAKRQRSSLTSDEKFKQALSNKMHPLHKDALNKLRNLNHIIVS